MRFSAILRVVCLLGVIAFAIDVRGENPAGETDGTVRDPISTASGEFYQTVEDIYLRGPIPISLARYYSTTLRVKGEVKSFLGNNWMHNYDLRLVLPVSATTAKVVFLRGRTIIFNLRGGKWEQETPTGLGYQLVQTDKLFRFLDPASRRIYTFNSEKAGRLELIEDRNGNALTLSYPFVLDQLSRISDGLGRTLDFYYDSGKLVRVRDQTGRSVSYGYAGNDLQGIVDVGGAGSFNEYFLTPDRAGLLVSETRQRKNIPFRQTYDTFGHVTSQTDAAENTTTFAYNTPSEGKTTVTDALHGKSVFQHSNGNLTEHVDEAGNSVTMTYDSLDRRTAFTDRLGNTTAYTYHSPSGYIESITYPDGSKINCTYSATTVNGLTFYDLTRASYPDGTAELLEYDTAGSVLLRTDRAGQKWRYAYNTRGQVLSAVLPSGGTVNFTYNDHGARVSMQLPGAGLITFDYDALDRMIRRNNPGGSSLTYVYDAKDNLLSVTDEQGNKTVAEYDTNGLPFKSIDAEGGATTFTLSGTDQPLRITDARGQQTLYVYDPLDRVKSIAYPNGTVESIGFDATGNPVTFTDGAFNFWKEEFDKNGREISLATPSGEKTQVLRDSLGRVTGVTTPLGNTWQFTYDSMGRLNSIRDPLSAATQFSYDARDAVTSIAMPEGVSATYERDTLGKITSITDPRGNIWRYAYDPLGRLTSSTDPLGNVQSYTRDERGRILKISFPGGNVQISQDAASRIVGKAYSDGTVLGYTYDTRGYLNSGNNFRFEHDAKGGLTNSNGLAIERDSVGRIFKITFAPGKTLTYAYDARGQLVDISDWIGGTIRLTHDLAGRRTAIIRPNGVTTRFNYDADGNVIKLTETGPSASATTTLVRDNKGQVVQASRSVPLTPTAAQLTGLGASSTFDAAYQVVGFSYDGLGRRTSDATNTYAWNLASRLTGLTQGGKSAKFGYDALGLRVSQTIDGVTRDFVWNYAFNLPSVGLIRQGGNDLEYYIHTPDGELLYSISASSGGRSFYHFDEMGNTLFLTGDAGAITDSYAYSPDGMLLASTGTSDNPFTFAGRYGALRLGSTNLYSMRLRIYDSSTGSFLSRDPIARLDPRQINPYQYALGNPLTFFDPTGEGVESLTISSGIEMLAALDGARRIGGLPVANARNEIQAFAEIANRVELHTRQSVNQGFWAIQRAGKFKKTNNIGRQLIKEILEDAIRPLTTSLTMDPHTHADRQAFVETPSGADVVRRAYGSIAQSTLRLFKDKMISESQKNTLLLQTRRILEDSILAAESQEEAEILLNLTVPSRISLLSTVPASFIGLEPAP